MFSSRLESAIKRYEAALNSLQVAKPKDLSKVQILDVLTARDEVQAALKNTTRTSGKSLATIIQLDCALKKHAELIAQVGQLEDWRTNFNPTEKAWWWFFEAPKRVPWWNRFDWLWTAVSVSCLTVSLGLVGDISSRFLTGGPDTLGALAVSTQSVLTLLAGGGALTIAGQEAIKRILISLNIPKHFWHEVSASLSLLLLLSLFGFRLSLPQIAVTYNKWGFENYQYGEWASAEFNYKRALQLNPDYAQAHFNLGLLYENLQNFDRARTEYQIAVQGNVAPALNNLSRLYILEDGDKNYTAAVSLLRNGFLLEPNKKLKLDTEVKHAMLKNLGWARLKQKNYPEAENYLRQAIELQKTAGLEDNIAAPHCLLAQVLEALGGAKKSAQSEWDSCLTHANPANPDEDKWIVTARQRLDDKGDKK